MSKRDWVHSGRIRRTQGSMGRSKKRDVLHSALVAILFLCLVNALFPHAASAQSSARAYAQFSADPRTLVQQMVNNELNAQKNDNTRWRFRDDKLDDGGPEQLMEIVQTKDGDIHRVLALDGQPLDATQNQSENARIQTLVADPDRMQQLQKQRHEDGEHERRLLAMLPEAFHYEYVGAEDGVIKLKFQPNDGFHTSQREERVFHHMDGMLYVDAHQKRLVEISGHLTSEVKFGGGFLGHLDPDGTFVVKQSDVGDGHWEVTQLDVHMNGRILFFKSINVKQREVRSNFQPISSDLTLHQGAELLAQDATAFAKDGSAQKPQAAKSATRAAASNTHNP
jgi:hypothetical protein